MKKNIILRSVFSFGVIVILVGAGLHSNIIKLPITSKLESVYLADFGNDKVLVGASSNVFVGKVIKQVGSKELVDLPSTQFLVDVVLNIKGGFEGSIVVSQEGGYKNGILYIVDEGDTFVKGKEGEYLLQPGSTYVFATTDNHRMGLPLLGTHPNSLKLISDNKSLNTAQLKSLAERDAKVQGLREAYVNEVAPWFQSSEGIKNSFRSLPLAEQERIKAEVAKSKPATTKTEPQTPSSSSQPPVNQMPLLTPTPPQTQPENPPQKVAPEPSPTYPPPTVN